MSGKIRAALAIPCRKRSRAFQGAIKPSQHMRRIDKQFGRGFGVGIDRGKIEVSNGEAPADEIAASFLQFCL